MGYQEDKQAKATARGRAILKMRDVKGMKFRDIGAEFNITGKAASALHRRYSRRWQHSEHVYHYKLHNNIWPPY